MNHHSNSRRFFCPCGQHHEWPNRPGVSGLKVRSGLVNGKSHTQPWLRCSCGTVHTRGETGKKEYAERTK